MLSQVNERRCMKVDARVQRLDHRLLLLLAAGTDRQPGHQTLTASKQEKRFFDSGVKSCIQTALLTRSEG